MAATPLVIAVDSSTTSTKAIVVDALGNVVAGAKREFPMSTPKLDYYEQDPRDWWDSTNVAVGEAVAKLSAADRGRITHVCATIQRQSFALLDESANPLRPGILWLDGRAAEQARRLGSARIHELSGFQPDVTPSIYKIAWLKEHEPENLRRAAHVVTVHGYLAYRLTGRWVDSVAAADSLGLLDSAHRQFSPELLELAGLDEAQLPELVAPTTDLGPIGREVLDGWSIKQRVHLVAGCGDGQAAALGAGATELDEAYLNMGTAVVGGVHSPDYRTADVFRTDVAGIPGRYVLEIVQNSGAHLAGWFREKLGDPRLGGKPDPQLDAAAARVPAGCGGLFTMPYWNAVQSPHWDPLAHGAIVGLAPAYDRPALYRSVLEGVCLETAANLRGLIETTGVALTNVRVMGGGQRSALWRQIMTDCIGLPLTECVQEEISAMGAAVMAMACAGVHGSVAQASHAMAQLGETSEPDAHNVEVYREAGEIHRMLYPALKSLMEKQYEFAQKYPVL